MAAQASAGAEHSQAKASVELRRAAIASFLDREREARPGLRIVPGEYGLPKVMLRDGGTLSAPSALAPEDIARNFLRENYAIFPFTPAEVDNLRLIVKDVTAQATFLAFSQTLNGIDVFNGQIKVTLTKTGEIVQVAAGDLIPELSLGTRPRLSYEEGVVAALRATGTKLQPAALARSADPNGKVAFRNPHGERYSPITSELTIFPIDAATARLAYRISLDTDPKSWYEVVIDAQTGAVLLRHNLYTTVGQANVWTQSPLIGTRQMVTFPDGWLPTTANGSGGWVTTGNNADAYLDADGNDVPDSTTAAGLQSARAYSATAVFDFPFGDGTTNLNPRLFQAASVSNLFYFINVAHDYYYNLGFNEAAGNFQTNNFGRGGVGGDAVVGEAQQGNNLNNASFAPTAEGTPPKLRVGLVTMGTSSVTDDLDFDYAAQTLLHEYGHGVSNRLVGSKTSTSCLAKEQSGAMGEGWSDYFAISYTNNPVLGAYGGNATNGIRRHSYEGYPYTYQDIGNGSYGYEVHDDGEIWAGTLWDLRKSLGQAVTDLLVMNGLKATPCSPTMVNARDAILSADQATNGGANRTAIWQVFARHGLGYSASGVEGTVLTGTEYDAANDLPPDLQTLKNPAITSRPLTISASNGIPYSYTVAATNPNSGTLNYALTSGPAGMTLDPVSGRLTWTTTFADQRVKITVTDGKGGSVIHGYQLPVLTPLTLGSATTISGAIGSDGYAYFQVPSGSTAVLQVTLRGTSGDADLYAIDPDGYYDYSVRVGDNETLSYASPKAGVWTVMVDGYATYSGVSLMAALVTPAALSTNATLPNLSGVIGSETLYKVTLPTGATSFRISTGLGTGDVDIYLRHGSPALCQASLDVSQDCYADYWSAHDGNSELISLASPLPGDWYLDLSGYDVYSGVTLATVTTAPSSLAVSPATLTFQGQAGANPASASVLVTNPGGTAIAWTATAASPGNWLSVSPSSGTTDGTLQVSVAAAGMAAGSYTGTVTITSPGVSPATINVTLTLTAPVSLVITPATLSFQSSAGTNPPSQNLTIGSSGAALAWTATAASTGNWLTVSPSSGNTSGTLQVSVTAGTLTAGNYSGTVSIASAGAANSPAVVQVSLTLASPGPTIKTTGGVIGAASSLPAVTTISPGGFATIFGTSLAPAGTARSVQASDMVNGILPINLAGSCVQVDGKAGFLTYVSPTQINLQVPAISVGGNVNVQVITGCGTPSEARSPVVTVASAAASPEFLYWTWNTDGRNPVIAVNSITGAYVAARGLIPGVTTVPAKPGDYLTVYGISFGPTSPSFAPGSAPSTVGNTASTPVVTLGSVILGQADVLYAGVSPGTAGLYQLNIHVPTYLTSGDMPLTLTLGTYKTPLLGFVTVSTQ